MCCGKKRKQARQTTQTRRVSKSEEKITLPSGMERDSLAYFQYMGKQRLRVVGPKTRKLYHFDRPGAVVAVDPKDQHALAAVSALKQVK
jgi:hypothetical protein